MPGTPGGAALEQFGPSERQDVDRRVTRPFEQVLNEVEQRLVSPLHVLEDEHRRVDVGQPLDEQPPRREEVIALIAAFVEREQVRETWLDESPLIRVGKVFLDDGGELGERGQRFLVLCDSRTHPDHVGQRPVGDALAVREASPAVPVRDLSDPVEVLVELPRQPRLADPGDARDRDQVRLALVRADMEEILDLTQLPVAADERCFETGRLERSARSRHDPQRLVERDETDLALQLVTAGVGVRDRVVCRTLGRLTDQGGARLGGRLHARRSIDEITGDHPLAGRA